MTFLRVAAFGPASLATSPDRAGLAHHDYPPSKTPPSQAARPARTGPGWQARMRARAKPRRVRAARPGHGGSRRTHAPVSPAPGAARLRHGDWCPHGLATGGSPTARHRLSRHWHARGLPVTATGYSSRQRLTGTAL